MKRRTSRKQVISILEAISTNTLKYELIPFEACGRWEYSISTYTREPKLVDMWGHVYTYTSWEHKERILEYTTLKNAYEFAINLLHETVDKYQSIRERGNNENIIKIPSN